MSNLSIAEYMIWEAMIIETEICMVTSCYLKVNKIPPIVGQ